MPPSDGLPSRKKHLQSWSRRQGSRTHLRPHKDFIFSQIIAAYSSYAIRCRRRLTWRCTRYPKGIAGFQTSPPSSALPRISQETTTCGQTCSHAGETPPPPPASSAVARISSLLAAPITVENSPKLAWQRLPEIRAAQEKAIEQDEQDPPHTRAFLRKAADGKLWIPRADRELQLRMCAAAHLG